jgi:hypothetical protein
MAVRHDAGRLLDGRAPGCRVRGRGLQPPPPGDAAPRDRRQLERFIGILIEQHAGALPAWLSPLQVVVAPITDAQTDYAVSVAKALQKQGVRVESDLRNEKITRKIREQSMQKVPYILVVGDKEKASGAVSVRARGNLDLGVMALETSLRRSPATSATRSSKLSARLCRLVRLGVPSGRVEGV